MAKLDKNKRQAMRNRSLKDSTLNSQIVGLLSSGAVQPDELKEQLGTIIDNAEFIADMIYPVTEVAEGGDS